MYTDLMHEFCRNGDEVYVLAPSIDGKEGLDTEGLINVLRVKTGKLFNVNPVVKGISNLTLPYLYSRAIKKNLSHISFDLILTATPPITLYPVIKKIKRKSSCKVYLILRDIFPQNAKDLEIIKNPILYSFFRYKERKLYRICDTIGCMSIGNINYVVNHNKEVERSKLHLLPNWIDLREIGVDNYDVKSELDIRENFVVLYGGNLGIPQEAEVILELARELQNLQDVIFLIIGNGTEKLRLKKLIVEYNLKNVLVKDHIPRDKYKMLVKQCDIGLVNLSRKFTIPNIPSRTLSYWEAHIPVLASIDRSTDFGEILDETNSGLWSITGDVKSYKENFMRLYKDSNFRKELGENGYQYLSKDLTVKKAYETIKKYL
ncbi:glycosyltransferase family 4 protein [Marinifilum flexuosum]|uniref:glycosyltransferase family 4 protein n=1 Tax=Marinifilum flexuosum TaxID=1117708 RepID=UPI0024927059|nr:glycosyltransferase family 4 protein [Marinifilum flexuosum]